MFTTTTKQWDTAKTSTSDLNSGVKYRVFAAVVMLAHAVGHADLDSRTGDCIACGRSMPWEMLELGHIVAASNGGRANPSNLSLQCGGGRCNRVLGDRDLMVTLTPKYVPAAWDGTLPLVDGNPRASRCEDEWDKR